MTALATIAELASHGVQLRIDGSEIVLSGGGKFVTAELIEQLRKNKADLMRSLIEIRTAAGGDWREISGDTERLRAFIDLLTITAMRERGQVPAHYTATTNCRRCGVVPIFPGLPAAVDGCPWCHNRLRGLPMPNAS